MARFIVLGIQNDDYYAHDRTYQFYKLAFQMVDMGIDEQ